MKQYIYFTESNGFVNSLKYREGLDTIKNLEAFTGKTGLSYISIQTACGLNPTWDGEKYISNSVQRDKQNCEDLYDSIESHFLIVANGKTYNFGISKKLDFFAKFVLMADDDLLEWTAYDNVAYYHTKAEALAVIASADVFLRSLFNAKKADKALCESGDNTMPNLNEIKQGQDILREGGE